MADRSGTKHVLIFVAATLIVAASGWAAAPATQSAQPGVSAVKVEAKPDEGSAVKTEKTAAAEQPVSRTTKTAGEGGRTRSRAQQDARACLEFDENRKVTVCAEKFR